MHVRSKVMGNDRVKMVPLFLTSATRWVVVPSAHISKERGGRGWVGVVMI